MSTAVSLDESRQEKAKEYARIHRRLLLVDLALGAAYISVWLAAGLNITVRDWIASLTTEPALEVLLFIIIFSVPYMLLDLPLSLYGTYILPHRYGQSNQTLRGWMGDRIKGLLISAPLGLLFLESIYWLLRTAPELWWLYTGGLALLFTVILANLYPVLIAPLFNTFSPLEDADLSQRLLVLAERAGTHVNGVFRFDMSKRTKSANAALVGLGKTRRIVLGDTLLDEFTADEIETVLAHELGHHVHRDIAWGIAINSSLTLLSFWVTHLVLRWSTERLGLASVADPAGMPILILVAALTSLVAMPLSNAYSRWRERLADRYALEITRKPEAFASAMVRLANQNLADVDPEAWVVFLLHSHPPIKERVTVAHAFAATMSS